MADLVDPNHYEYTYPEERMPKECYRVDVIFEGALEMAENFNLNDAENEYDTQVDDLTENLPDRDWTVSIYDERTEPPTCIREIHNEPIDN